MLEDRGGAHLNCFPQRPEDLREVVGSSNDAEGAGPEAQRLERRLGAGEEFVGGGSLRVHRENAPEVRGGRGWRGLTDSIEEAPKEPDDVLEGEAVASRADRLHLTDFVREVLRRWPRVPRGGPVGKLEQVLRRCGEGRSGPQGRQPTGGGRG